MLIAPKFLDYERPERHLPRDPEVLVRSQVVERFGMPNVNYSNLGKLMMDDLGFESGQTPVISIYHKLTNYDNPLNQALHQGIDRHSYRFGNMLHINADKRIDRFSPEPDHIDSKHVMRGVIVQAAAYASIKHDTAFRRAYQKYGLLVGGGAAALIAGGIVLGSDPLAESSAVPVLFGAAIAHAGRKTVLGMVGNGAIRRHMPQHRHDIVFPETEQEEI